MSSTPRTGMSSIATTRSSARRPAAAAGEAGATSTTSTPRSRPTEAATRGGSGRVPPAMPIHARRTRPSRISAEITARVVALIGIASPRPTPATAVLMPTTRPRPSTSAPPELPGLSAASVWMTSSTIRVVSPERVGSERPSAETTPAVTEPANPCGLPIATTSWPTRSAAASPSSAGVCASPSARSTARSESGSAPTTRASTSRPSVNAARMRGLPRRLSTTWAEVSMKPSGVITTPEPPPRRATRRLATDGASSSATCVTTRE